LKLCTQEFDENEYRLSLWLPLSVEEKVDMVLNQKSTDELEIMMFLLEEEFGIIK